MYLLNERQINSKGNRDLCYDMEWRVEACCTVKFEFIKEQSNQLTSFPRRHDDLERKDKVERIRMF